MNPLKKLFVPVDGSENSKNAADYADRLALRESASVTFCNAVDFSRDDSAPPSLTSANTIVRLAAMRRYGREVIAGALTDAIDRAVAARVLELGNPSPCSIVNAARRRDASAIVVGSEAQNANCRTIVGSLADDVLRLSEKPVFLVSRPSRGLTPISSIVVGVDGSAPSAAALEFAMDLAADGHARIVAVNVLARHVPNATVKQRRKVLDEALARAEQRGVAIEAALARGHVLDELLDSVKAVNADLLILGSHGPCMLRALPVGSIGKFASKLCPVPVAVVRAEAVAPLAPSAEARGFAFAG